jgi:hypothetical protein
MGADHPISVEACIAAFEDFHEVMFKGLKKLSVKSKIALFFLSSSREA